MPIVVPHRKSGQPVAQAQAQQPDPVFMLAAATQMHSEGRLLAQNTPTEDDQWKSGNWEDTWKKFSPDDGGDPIPKGWETIHRNIPSSDGGRPTPGTFARPPQDLVS